MISITPQLALLAQLAAHSTFGQALHRLADLIQVLLPVTPTTKILAALISIDAVQPRRARIAKTRTFIRPIPAAPKEEKKKQKKKVRFDEKQHHRPAFQYRYESHYDRLSTSYKPGRFASLEAVTVAKEEAAELLKNEVIVQIPGTFLPDSADDDQYGASSSLVRLEDRPRELQDTSFTNDIWYHVRELWDPEGKLDWDVDPDGAHETLLKTSPAYHEYCERMQHEDEETEAVL